MNKQNHHAAIFDLDGTLLDTLDDLANAANAALHSAGYPQHPVAAYRQFVGNGLRMLVRRALPAYPRTLAGTPKARHPLGRRDEQAARMDAPHAQALLSRESFPVHSGGYAEPAP